MTYYQNQSDALNNEKAMLQTERAKLQKKLQNGKCSYICLE